MHIHIHVRALPVLAIRAASGSDGSKIKIGSASNTTNGVLVITLILIVHYICIYDACGLRLTANSSYSRRAHAGAACAVATGARGQTGSARSRGVPLQQRAAWTAAGGI